MDKLMTNNSYIVKNDNSIFDNEIALLWTPRQAAQITGYSIKTIYDWKYNPKKYGVPKDLYDNRGRKIRASALRAWLGI